MKLKKLLVLGLALACIATISITATLAYFTDSTEVVTNTFTVGSIKIDLDEAPVDDLGKVKEGDRTKANTYELFPGSGYDKDPTVHVTKGSEKCYVFVTIKNELEPIEAEYVDENGNNLGTIAAQMENNGWVKLGDEADGSDLYVYNLTGGDADTVVDAAADDVDLVLFTNFAIQGYGLVSIPEGEEVPADMINLQDYADKQIVINAYAIQSANMSGWQAAWDSYCGQNGDPTAATTPDVDEGASED